MGGSPAYWRTSESDADRNPEWVNVWLEEFDAISPWTIGRYNDEESADRFEEEKIKGDVEFIKEHNDKWETNRDTMRRIGYIPVIHPGGSVSQYILASAVCRQTCVAQFYAGI